MAASAKVIKLRELLAEKFPDAHANLQQQRPAWHTGLPCLDEAEIPRGALTEIVSTQPTQGSALLLNGLLHAATENGYHLALIDGRNSFDPQSAGFEACQRMLWIRCKNALEAMKAADLVLRDGNLPLSILDLRLNPERELRRIHKPLWYRLQTLVQRTQGTALILTPRPMVSSAMRRFDIGNSFHLDDLEVSQQELFERLHLPLTRQRHHWKTPPEANSSSRQTAIG